MQEVAFQQKWDLVQFTDLEIRIILLKARFPANLPETAFL